MVYSSFEYKHIVAYSNANNFFIWGLGLKYVPEFQLKKPNLTENLRDKSSCLLIFAPFTIFYDMYYAVVQHVLPTNFFILSALYLVANGNTGTGVGVGIAPGLTSGNVDIKLPLKYLSYDRTLSDWQVRLELSYHMAFGGKVAEYKPMIEDGPRIIK